MLIDPGESKSQKHVTNRSPRFGATWPMRDNRVPMKEEKPLIHVRLTKQATTLCDKLFSGGTWQRDERSFESSPSILALKDWISCPECLKRAALETNTLPSEIGISPVETTQRDNPTSISLASLGSQLKVR